MCCPENKETITSSFLGSPDLLLTDSAKATAQVIILYVDANLIVLNKPSGLLSVPGRGENKQDCLSSRVQAEYPDALTVHRLDMETSGLIIMARGKNAQRLLSLAFEKRQIEKRYIAIVSGHPQPANGEINLPLICDWPNRPRQKVDFDIGKPSLTRYQVLATESDRSRIALFPETGRSHQLRVHLQALGHPILGDVLYADAAAFAKADRLLLHAEYLALPHPDSGERLEFSCPPPF